MQGGVRYVYYLLKDAKGKPLANATVILNSGESITSTDSGEVGIPIRAGDKGVGTYPLDLVKEVRLGGQILSIKNPPRLTLQVLPREWERHWEFGAKASVSAGIEAYVKGQLGDGLDLGLEKEGAILVGRSSKVGVGGGVEIGPSFKLTGVLEAKAAASGEVMCLFTRDELYRFPEGTSNLEEKKALASLLVYLLASGANRFNPVVGAILEALWMSGDVYQKYLLEQGITGGLSVEGSAGLSVGIGLSEEGAKKAGFTLGIGAEGTFSFTSQISFKYYPKEEESGIRLDFAASVSLGPTGDLGTWTANLGFEVVSKLTGMEIRYDLSGNTPKALILILSDDKKEIHLRINKGDANKNGKDDVQEVIFKVIWAEILAGALASAPPFLVSSSILQDQLSLLFALLKEIGGEYEVVSKQIFRNVTFELEFKLAMGVTIGLGGELTLQEHKDWVMEKGLFYQGKCYPLERYSPDAYLADDGRTFKDIVDAATTGLWEYMKDLVQRALQTIQAAAEWTVQVTIKTAEGVVVGGLELLGKAGSVVKDTTIQVFSWVGRKIGSVLPKQLMVLAEPRALSTPLPWEGLLVVGAFYKLDPDGLVLQKPATLKLSYTDDVLPAGIDPAELDIYMWDPERGWIALGASLDRENRTLTAEITRFSIYAIGIDLPPSPPTNLTAHASPESVFLSWESAGEPDLQGFHVYRSTTRGGPYTRLTSTPLAVPHYLDTAVTPDTTYYYVVTAVDGAGHESEYSQEVAATVELSFFRTGFENLDGWTKTGLWHLQDTACFECDLMEGSFAYYAQPDSCTYEVKDKRGRSVRTSGTLTSPIITIPKNTALTLQFDFFREVENYTRSTLDRTYVQIRLGTSGKTVRWGSWKTIWSRSSKDPSPECNTASYTFQSKSYDRLQIRFVFDSVNGNNNQYRGWAIDNLVVKPAPTPTKALEVTDLGLGWDVPEDFEPGEMKVLNIPNPVRDVHTTVFTVLGVEAEGIKVEVYDLTGRLVWKGEAEGNELPWDTRDLTGLPLANGVYLYLVYVKVEGEWIVSDVQKLVILR
jgi:hypothetical protein